MKIVIKDVKKFIKTSLRKKLNKDLDAMKIFKEADVETCAYFYFRKFLNRDKSWTIIARKHVNKKYYVDLMLYKNKKPAISIELKWNEHRIVPKDKKSLVATIKNQQVSAAFYICVILNSKKDYRKNTKVKRLHEIPIKLTLTGDKKKQYIELRKIYRENIMKGRIKIT